jgi:ADP-heptose:LPS heptosyltransferase
VTAPRRILVSRIRQIGDAILSLPVVDALHQHYPDAAIDYLAEEGPSRAAVNHPAIRRVISYRASSWPGLPAPPSVLASLATAGYDLAVDLYGNPRSALLVAITGAPVRVGPARRGRRHLYTHTIQAPAGPLPANEHHLLSLRALGLDPRVTTPRIWLADAERAGGRAELDRAAPPGAPRVGIHVGNRWAAKRWPEEKFRALLRALSKVGARGIVLAGPGEEALARRVAAPGREGAGPAPVIAGLPLRRYWSVLASLDAFVTNDGSPLHAGPAVGVPTVGILGPTEPEIWFPYSAEDGHQLLCADIWCRPCHRHSCFRMDCLHWIGVGEALQAVERALARGWGNRVSA